MAAGESCSVSGTVCGGGSTCANGICTCAPGAAPQNGQCLPLLSVTVKTLPICKSYSTVIKWGERSRTTV